MGADSIEAQPRPPGDE